MRNKIILFLIIFSYAISLFSVYLFLFDILKNVNFYFMIFGFLIFVISVVFFKIKQFNYLKYKELTNKYIFKRSFLLKVCIYGIYIISLFFIYNFLALLFYKQKFNLFKFIQSIIMISIFIFGFIDNYKKSKI
ncbi:MAG: hypothetical protein US19_C0025G0017 [Candidatus Daviesbacteria bacterium GW2011_GWB1_36_5]|uniref:Uncharacterized protein n=1 Tax=Candidatus Daviesbacteria bacterium GW2011_GWB1_36_5 TaxID=1618426 RepID=A0A0G0EMY9_9BACT|nr:MAG: hypothetical protein US19_C0025G0017 [Candidatus Daviesbacteria bacterium GW2011_GWB1_36_5]